MKALVKTAMIAAGAAMLAGSSAAAAQQHVPREGASGAGKVSVTITRKDARVGLQRSGSLTWRRGEGDGGELVRVSPARIYQRLSAGFGVSITDTSAWAIREKLPRRLRDRVMRLLFSPEDGIGLSYTRVPVGGSDYIVNDPYTYDDVPAGESDPALRRFGIFHDRAYILPALRQALRLNPRMTIMANPWSPPAWMKTDDSIIPTGATASQLRADSYGPLARYLVSVLKAYRAAGAPIDQLGVQNEPLNPLLDPMIPGMYLPAADEARLIREHVAPALRQARLRPRLLIYDWVYPSGTLALPGSAEYIPTVMDAAASDVGGIALHCYLSDAGAGSAIHSLYPSQPQFETECSSYLSQIEPAQMAIRVLRNWAQGVQLWNAALDERYGPKVGAGCRGIFGRHAGEECIAPVIVDTARHRFRLTSDYWQLGQFSRFIRLGARRIASTTPSDCHDGTVPLPPCGLEDVAFRNPNGSLVVVATANDGRPHRLRLVAGGRHVIAKVPDGAVVTYRWR